MVQLSVISGKYNGSKKIVERLPLIVGRDESADFRIEDEGIWDKHFQIIHKPADGYFLEVFEPALVSVNDAYVNNTRLKNGDTIQAGAVKFKFWLSEVEQKKFVFHEIMLWASLFLITISQIFLIYYLIRITE